MFLYLMIKNFTFVSLSKEEINTDHTDSIVDSMKCLYLFIQGNHNEFNEIFTILDDFYSNYHPKSPSQNDNAFNALFVDINSIKRYFTDPFSKLNYSKPFHEYSFDLIDNFKTETLYLLAKRNIKLLEEVLKRCVLWIDENEITQKFIWNIKEFKKNLVFSSDYLSFCIDENFKNDINNHILFMKSDLSLEINFATIIIIKCMFDQNNCVDPENIQKKIFILFYYGLVKKIEQLILFAFEISHYQKTNSQNILDISIYKFFYDLVFVYEKSREKIRQSKDTTDNDFFESFLLNYGIYGIIGRFKLFKTFLRSINQPFKDKEFLNCRKTIESDFLINGETLEKYIEKKILKDDNKEFMNFKELNLVKYVEWLENYNIQAELSYIIMRFLKNYKTFENNFDNLKSKTMEKLSELGKDEFIIFKDIMHNCFAEIYNMKQNHLQNVINLINNPYIYGIYVLDNHFLLLEKAFKNLKNKIQTIFENKKKISNINTDIIKSPKILNEYILKMENLLLNANLIASNYKGFINDFFEDNIPKHYLTNLSNDFDSSLDYIHYDRLFNNILIYNPKPHCLFKMQLYKINSTRQTYMEKTNKSITSLAYLKTCWFILNNL